MTIVPLSPAVHLSEGAASPRFAIYIFYCETVLGDFFSYCFLHFLDFLLNFFLSMTTQNIMKFFFKDHCIVNSCSVCSSLRRVHPS